MALTTTPSAPRLASGKTYGVAAPVVRAAKAAPAAQAPSDNPYLQQQDTSLASIEKTNPGLASNLRNILGRPAPTDPNQAVPAIPTAPEAPKDATAPANPTPAQGAPEQQATSQSQLPATQTADTATPAAGVTTAVTQPDKYQAGLASAKASGLPAPQNASEGSAVVKQFTQSAPETPPEVNAFLTTNPSVSESTKALVDFLSPQSTKDSVASAMKNYLTDQRAVAGLNMDLMNIKNVMDGTDQDIRDEVTKAGGFASDSQVRALTIGRNQTLLKQATQLQDQLASMKDVINSDVTLIGLAKDQAQQEFQQRSFLLNYQQQNDQFVYKASQDAAKNQLEILGADGLYASAKNDPVMLGRIEKTLQIPPGSLSTAAAEAAQTRALALKEKQASIAASQASTANAYSEIRARNAAASGSTSADAIAWAQNIKAGTAKLSDVPTAMRNAVSQALVANGSSQSDILKTTKDSLSQLQTMVDSNQGFSSAVGAKGFAQLFGLKKTPIAGSAASDFTNKLNQVKNDVIIPNLNLLHGLGRVTDREFQALSSAVTDLNTTQSEGEFKKSLKTLNDSILSKESSSAPAPNSSSAPNGSQDSGVTSGGLSYTIVK